MKGSPFDVFFLIDFLILSHITSIVLDNVSPGILFSFLFCLGFFAFRAYDPKSLDSFKEQFLRILVSSSFVVLIIVIAKILFGLKQDSFLVSLEYVFSIAVFPPLHKLEFNIYLKLHPTKKFIVVGKKHELMHVIREIEEASFGKFQCLKWVNPSTSEAILEPVSYDFVLVADPDLEDEARKIFKATNQIRYRYLYELAERFLNRIPFEIAVKFEDHYKRVFSQIKEPKSKRLLDVIFSAILLVIFSPIMIAISLAIMIEDGLPVVFKQERVGKDGRIFTMWKFRSMKNVDEDNNQARFATDEEFRILKVGRFIRPFRLDETMQFWNVFKGEMSLVGPRPEQVPIVEDFKKEIPFYVLRHKVKPGITGWAQLMYQYAASKEETTIKLSYDLWYVKNRNILLDLRIILQTVEAVLWRRGAK